MNILSLNTWGGTLEVEIAAFIHEQKKSIDVFCFQEVYPEMRALCAELLPEYAEFYAHKFVTEDDDFHQATYIRKGLEIVDTGTVLMEVPLTGLGLWVEMWHKGEPLVVCNYHGMARPGNKLDTPERVMASEGLVSYFGTSSKDRVIIGDFNLLNTVRSVAIFEESGYVDLIKKCGVTNTRNKYAWERHPDSIQYFADFAFMHTRLAENNFTVLPEEVSDHAALLLEL